jgi:hypothetical protein
MPSGPAVKRGKRRDVREGTFLSFRWGQFSTLVGDGSLERGQFSSLVGNGSLERGQFSSSHGG